MSSVIENIPAFRISNGKELKKRSSASLDLSVVVPIHDERENIQPLLKEIHQAAATVTDRYEIIFINDGSTDGSSEILRDAAGQDTKLRVIQFRKNYGQTAALCAGFKYANGEIIVTLDGDLQNDPADIPMLIQTLAKGFDLVNGWRKNRQDKFITRRIPSIFANRFINKLIEGTGVRLNDYGCSLKAYKRGLVENINLYGEMHRFIPVFAAWLGARVTEVPVNHRPRKSGLSKYNISRLTRVIFDLIVVRFFADYLTRPIQFFGKITIYLLQFLFALLALLVLLQHYSYLSISLNTLLIIAGIGMFSGLQLLAIGLLGEILIRSYFETQKKDVFVIQSIIEGAEQELQP